MTFGGVRSRLNHASLQLANPSEPPNITWRPLRCSRTPAGMTRRHFMQHLAGASALAVPALTLTNSLLANADELEAEHKSAILLWMGGGPSTIDIWDLKPGAPTGGPFKPISTTPATCRSASTCR